MGVLAIPSIINSYEYEVEYRMKRKILFLHGYLYVYIVRMLFAFYGHACICAMQRASHQ